ncbi:hypothetical protein PUP68_19595 [Pseudomonas chlororaphis]|uniref:hypothetical protein n=1 Tax=Pseudomonas chlororaphis TaxID=587753 RepID=UPI00087A49F2|nr:hypothetical protein [Pseudomonas chlororaphis]AZC31743.1 hypothetical protein C4K38_3785 [Pseudomonas chlororaphis subsp. piscium]WDG77705.1 hypothetical protein PUP77_25265 [Pseudomonas chlororaphis]WDG83058.1 hypothetical protein PUP68_19595 [Pseudomonas chlororaphis]WDG89516.1 hypothetical protein PUP49_19680 [Pseudomonas chlororaphis]SDS83746.1 hypothetical protein SAMN05216585_3603 [Pseudomonas chlororaphis]
MTYKLPEYIPTDLINVPATYSWSDWDPYEEFADIDPITETSLSQISDRAITAYCIGCSEWVVARLQSLHESSQPFLYLEALWVFEMTDDKFWLPEELDQIEWPGNILGAIGLSLTTVLNSVYGVEDETSVSDGTLAELLPLHVLPRQDEFLVWRGEVLDRLTKLYPRKRSADWGEPIPREALDPRIPLGQLDPKESIRRFLDVSDLQSNPYILPI